MAETPWDGKQPIPTDYETERIALSAGFVPTYAPEFMQAAELEARWRRARRQ
jgi:hypothetical protein